LHIGGVMLAWPGLRRGVAAMERTVNRDTHDNLPLPNFSLDAFSRAADF
jgi:hypothetical protein